jgi:hypothetical protein
VKGEEPFFLVRLELKILSHKPVKYMLASLWLFFKRAVVLNYSNLSDQNLRNFPPSEAPASLPLHLLSLSEIQRATNVKSLGHTLVTYFLPWENQFPLFSPWIFLLLCVVLRVNLLISKVHVDISNLKIYICIPAKVLTFQHPYTKNHFFEPSLVGHACNPSYLWGRDQEDLGLRRAEEKVRKIPNQPPI